MHNKLSDTQIHKLKKYFYRINKSWEQKDKNNISKYFTHFKYHLRGGDGDKEGDGKGESPPAPVANKIEELNKIIGSINFNDITSKVTEFKAKLENDKQTALDKEKAKVADLNKQLETKLEEINNMKTELETANATNRTNIENLQTQIASKNLELENITTELNKAIEERDKLFDTTANKFEEFKKSFDELLKLLEEQPPTNS